MPLPVAAIAGGALVASSMYGNKSGTNPMLQKAIEEFSRINAPTAAEMKVQLQQMVQQGLLSPEEAEAIQIDGSAFSDISTDPRIRNAQIQALTGLQDVANEGITPIEKAATRQIQDDLETTSRGDQMAIMENMKHRGIYGGGDELAQRLLASQAASSRASREGLQTAADARKRSLEAMMQTGQLSGQIRGQDYDEASRKAAALDEIRRFNATNRQNVNLTNTASRNRAQEVNLSEKQRVSDTNTAQENENRIRNADLVQREFDNKVKLAAGKSGQYANAAQNEEERRKNDLAYRAALLGAGGQMLSGMK